MPKRRGEGSRAFGGSIAAIAAGFGCLLLVVAPNDLDVGAKISGSLFFLVVFGPLLYLRTRGWRP